VSPAGRRPGKTDTRSAVLDAARECFADNGYDGTTIRAIARILRRFARSASHDIGIPKVT